MVSADPICTHAHVHAQTHIHIHTHTHTHTGTDEDYQVMTRGRLLDRIKVALAGHVAVRVVLGQETNTSQPG
jgi:ATP-dependent Zn protease